MEMDVWYDVLVRELAETERLNELLAQAEQTVAEQDAGDPAKAPDDDAVQVRP